MRSPLPKITSSASVHRSQLRKVVGGEVGETLAVPVLAQPGGTDDHAVRDAFAIHGDPACAVARDGLDGGFVRLEFHGEGRG